MKIRHPIVGTGMCVSAMSKYVSKYFSEMDIK